VGSFVWERLDGVKPLSSITEEIEACFEVQAQRASVGLLEFVDLLEQFGCALEGCP
jgi:hypothetical protein